MVKPTRASEMKVMASLRLRAARLTLGVERQEAMANKLQVGQTAYNNWETGKRLPDPLVMSRLLELTGIGPDWIYAGSLRGVPFEFAADLERAAVELGAAVHSALPEWPMVNARRVLPKPQAVARRRRGRGQTFHESGSDPIEH